MKRIYPTPSTTQHQDLTLFLRHERVTDKVSPRNGKLGAALLTAHKFSAAELDYRCTLLPKYRRHLHNAVSQ